MNSRFLWKILFIFFGLATTFGVRANNFYDFCIEGNPNATMSCRLKPDNISEWTYYDSIAQSNIPLGDSPIIPNQYILNYINAVVIPKNSSIGCTTTYEINEPLVSTRDGFVDSNEPIEVRTKLIHNNGCDGRTVQNFGNEYSFIAKRTASCLDLENNTPRAIWSLTDIQSKACTSQVGSLARPDEVNMCTAVGNPIHLPNREKIENIVDIFINSPMPLEFRRIYRSARAKSEKVWFNNQYYPNQAGFLGLGWVHNHDISIATIQRPGNASSVDTVRMQTAEGSFVYFRKKPTDSTYIAIDSRITAERSSLPNISWIVKNPQSDVQYVFNQDGRIIEQVERNGWKFTYTYENGKLKSVSNNFGKQLQFSYNAAGYLAQVTGSDERAISLAYDGNLLSQIIQTDGTSIGYQYTPASPKQLSGKFDELGTLYASFTYLAGQAYISQKAGGVEKYQMLYEGMFFTPLLGSGNFKYTKFAGKTIFLGATPPLSDTNVKSSSAIDANGLIVSELDQKQQRTNYNWDVARHLPVIKTEAAGFPESRSRNITWHHQWALPLTISEADKITSYTYDALGNQLSMTVLDNSQDGISRTTSWTYNNAGLKATETLPNGATTNFTYDAFGNVLSETNSLGHTTQYTYDASGRVITQVTPNGLVNKYAYDQRDRIKTIDNGGLITTYTYKNTGNLSSISFPHGHVITYTHDAAHRVVGWTDNRGASGTYTLDNLGNITAERVKDSLNQLVLEITKEIHPTNKLTRYESDRTIYFSYDPNGDVIKEGTYTDSKLYSRDALRRIKTITNAQNAITSIAYNSADSITSLTDPIGFSTTFTRDALGNATSEISPDIGSKIRIFDALGLLTSSTNALNHTTTIQRDLIGRPTAVNYTEGNSSLTYDQTTAGKGYLGRIENESGITSFIRDAHGRVTKKVQNLVNGNSRTLEYTYNPTTGLLSTIKYPSGKVLQYQYNTTGQIISIQFDGNNIITGIEWNPINKPTKWNWNLPGSVQSVPAHRLYDSKGRLHTTEFSQYYFSNQWQIGYISQALQTPFNYTTPYSIFFTYDDVGRIIESRQGENKQNITYDANGNITKTISQKNSITKTKTYQTSGNKQTSFTQAIVDGESNSTTSVNFQYNLAGDLISDGLRTYDYNGLERLVATKVGDGADAQVIQYAHNVLGQRVFKTEPIYSNTGDNADSLNSSEEAGKKNIFQKIYHFFTRLWTSGNSEAQNLGFSFVYGESDELLGEYGMGGSSSSGTTEYIYLPTTDGSMPIAAVIGGTAYAVHSDHLNTPRRLTQADGRIVWQWAYTSYGDNIPTIGFNNFQENITETTYNTVAGIPKIEFNLRYPGQYYDKESGLHYNLHRSYSPERGRYTQPDPIGVEGGFNRFAYVDGNPISFTDPDGLSRRSINHVRPIYPAIGPTSYQSVTHRHHSGPMFLGFPRNQELTPLARPLHESLHRDLNSFLRTQTNEFGQHMAPHRYNSGSDIRQNFSQDQRYQAMREFYNRFGDQYPQAARDFFRQFPDQNFCGR